HIFKIYGLGKVNFPLYAFAKKNFHYGYYADGDKANEILNFRNENLFQYFSHLDKAISVRQRTFLFLFRKLVKRQLLKRSHPYRAYLEKNEADLVRFF
ncbi:MAG: NAD(P)-dependent oxidoreductase, partial [Candidatus Azobacteroides sp.]|nr:NAD(P)-dependent oxidoreductase [Candidatus Azobacteroides sp.]